MIENFDKLEFNRKIDVLVAIHVFGWKEFKVSEHVWNYMGEGGVSWIVHDLMGNHVPCYSTLLTSAWDVVKKFDYMYLFRAKDWKSGQWECKLVQDEYKYYAWAETEQLSICYAGLTAIGFDLKSFLQEEGKS